MIIKDFSRSLNITLDETTGFLTSPVVLARTGVQEYYGFELGLTDDRIDKKVGVFRSPDEVFSGDSVKTFTNLVATDDHPDAPVTVLNVKDLQVGTVSGVTEDKESGVLRGVLTITDTEEIKKIMEGKVEVSVGYENILVEESGVFDGKRYDFKQTKIKANHLAIVDAGRCGSACKIIIDHKKEKTMIITIDGIDYDVENQQLAQAITKQQSAHDAEMKKKEEDMEELEKKKKEADKKKDEAEAAKDAALKTQVSDSDISKLVNDRAVLIADAKIILGDSMPDCGDCPTEIKAAVIDHVMGETDLSGKSVDYITAMYDVAVKKSKDAVESLDNFGKDMKDKNGVVVTRDSLRQDHFAKKYGMEV